MLKIPKEIHLADPQFYVSNRIDLLIGVNLFWELLLEEKLKLGPDQPMLYNSYNTEFGYVIAGWSSLINDRIISCHFSSVHCPEDSQLKRFWEIEDVNILQPRHSDDEECENQFDKTTFRNEEGQFVVKFPLKHSPDLLGASLNTAVKRLRSLEKRFDDSRFKSLYFEFLQEYQDLGHMTLLPNYSVKDTKQISYFLPHHGILKEGSITTKLRTVFDGSCPTSSGWSLNDLQYIGPKLQSDIFNVLTRFRMYDYVVSADISKMYRCILINPDDRNLQRIIWRKNITDEFSIFELNTVTYGTSSAPYLAIKCLNTIALQYKSEFPDASNTILKDFYVDDLLTGSDDLHELNVRCNEIYTILASAHFILRKWISNDNNVLADLKLEHISNSVLDLGKNESCKTLGIHWFPNSDILSFVIKNNCTDISKNITKRKILSIVAQIYDPLGLVSPVIIVSKLIIQRLWSLKINWDDTIPHDLYTEFLKFHKNLIQLNELKIPRCFKLRESKLIDLHCFCDASQSAYATVIYARCEDRFGNFEIRLICSKTKVAPLKLLTIPKLELCAALLGAKLSSIVCKELSLTIPMYWWSDSKVVLSWIITEPKQLQVFVGNRVSQIQSLTNIKSWHYVNTKDNPADISSRGYTPNKLINSNLWWNGPEYLKLPIEQWPNDQNYLPLEHIPELKRKCGVFYVLHNESWSLFNLFSSFTKLLRITSLCIRFFNNLKYSKNKLDKSVGPLTLSELNNAKIILIRQLQNEHFANDIQMLKRSSNLGKNHRLSSLTPFIDEFDILRVGGRLKNTSLINSIKHPILLPYDHPFTKLLFQYKHQTLMHPGPRLLLSHIRQFYWPLKGKILAKSVTKACMVCFKFNPNAYSVPMSSLPDHRVQPAFPFQFCGVDYAGPFNILNKVGRGAKTIKCYLVVFICFCTKAIHSELVLNLSTEHFMACMNRFIARRGTPCKIYSDNGSTFVGAKNELRNLAHFLYNNQTIIQETTAIKGIEWIFIPPYSPNFGGLWEAAVKSMKHHLKRLLINRNVTYDELLTLIIQVEGILNSRPLFAMSSDPNDLSPISPSHFLLGRHLYHIPETDLCNIHASKLSRIQHIQRLTQQFWNQFKLNYVTQLHQQYKWKDGPSIIKEGALVLIKKDNHPSYQWPLGRIIRLLPSKDGQPRTAEIKTSLGTTRRSTRHLHPLPYRRRYLSGLKVFLQRGEFC